MNFSGIIAEENCKQRRPVTVTGDTELYAACHNYSEAIACFTPASEGVSIQVPICEGGEA